ncbi:MAG: 4Fe-4S binding protein [Alphaproteobacteria bacterium]
MNVQRLRFFVQLISFVLLVYGGSFAFDIGGKLPTFSCVFVDSKGGGCFLVSLQHQLARPIWAFLGGAGLMLLTTLGTVALFAIVLNKAWCGWVCPFGFLQDLMTKLRNLFNIDLSRFSWITSKRYRSVKYIFLAFLVLVPLAIGNLGLSREWTAPFCQMCPARPLMPLLEGNFSEFFIDLSSIPGMILTTIAILLVGLFFTVSFIKRRFLCSYCPMLAFLSLFDKVGLLSLKKDGQRCTRCGNCYRACPMEIRAIEEEKVKKNLVTQDCILCLRCVESCPENGALDATFAGFSIFKASEEGFLKRQEKTIGESKRQ